MLKPIKILLRVVVGLVIVLVLAVVLGMIYMDSIARKGIEVGATYAMGVNTTLDKASIGLFSGNFGLNGLKVDNPAGFEGKFMSLGKGGVAVSMASLMSDTVNVPKFELDSVELDLERSSKGANYQIIMDNLKKLESGSKPAPKESKPGKKFKIKEISITNVTVHMDLLGGPGGATKLNIPIAEIKLTDVGSDGSGVDIPKLSAIILEAVLTAAVEKGGGLIPADVMGELKGGLGQLSGLANVGLTAAGKVGEQLTTVGKDLGKAVGDVGKEAGKAVDDLTKGLGGLIPGSKKDGK